MSDDSMSDEMEVKMYHTPPSTPTEFCKKSEETVNNLLHDKSRASHEITYNRFTTWQKQHKTTSFSQRVLTAYFSELSNKWKSSTLWSEYSKLGKMLLIKHNVYVREYSELKAFLKKKSVGYRPKTSKTLTSKELEKYLNEAPDETCLATKVAAIFGVLGACRKDELIKVETSHLRTFYEPEDTDQNHPILLVRLPDTKTHQEREFTVKGNFYEFYKRYSDLRPENTPHERFFVNYQQGKCTIQPIGKRKFAMMPKVVANFFNLKDPEAYTGHAFRRTSATLLAEAGADITTLKRHGGWKSTSVAEEYVENSLLSKKKISDQITSAIHLRPSASSHGTAMTKNPQGQNRGQEVQIPSTLKQHDFKNKENSQTTVELIPSEGHVTLSINNCSNCTFSILEKK